MKEIDHLKWKNEIANNLGWASSVFKKEFENKSSSWLAVEIRKVVRGQSTRRKESGDRQIIAGVRDKARPDKKRPLLF